MQYVQQVLALYVDRFCRKLLVLHRRKALHRQETCRHNTREELLLVNITSFRALNSHQIAYLVMERVWEWVSSQGADYCLHMFSWSVIPHAKLQVYNLHSWLFARKWC